MVQRSDVPVRRGAPDGGTTDIPVWAGLQIRAFRGLRYNADRVTGLAAVTSPPYDVIDPEDATRLEDLDPHNVVRLILPREPAEQNGSPVPSTPWVQGDHPRRYAAAATLLQEWLADGVLALDDRPRLYVYEQGSATHAARGLIAAVGLCAPEERIVLPHEDVMPGPVADRLALMRATVANLEPILLTLQGGPVMSAAMNTATGLPPLFDTVAEDSSRQRLWALEDEGQIGAIADELFPRQALIADGHHRWATYRRLQAEMHAHGAGSGPWDFGLAMLVDATRAPLQVAAIHRVVADLSLDHAVSQAAAVFATIPLSDNLADALSMLDASEDLHSFVLTDGTQFHLVHSPDPARLAEALPPGHSARWRALDASVLHALLLEDVWQVQDEAHRVSYLHDAQSAVRTAVRRAGVAVLMRPTTTAAVMALAADGERMPRKSTSFGPKPRSGFVMRLLREPVLSPPVLLSPVPPPAVMPSDGPGGV